MTQSGFTSRRHSDKTVGMRTRFADPDEDEDDVEIVPVPMDRVTRERLVVLSKKTGKQPIHVAGDLLRDVLIDDEMFNARPSPGAPLN